MPVTRKAAPAAAHHGWEDFDTTAAYYIAGSLTDVRWGNPHVGVTLRVADTAVPPGWAERELPSELVEILGRDTMRVTRPYTGGQQELQLTLAPIEYMARWGLDRRLEKGERIEAVGFVHREQGSL
ncbi:DUF6152 family protein [Nonomuraea sp. NPDC046802]|uniref:DUF6152 family protein n=1 Tax=Nonomuraea sp. NPDC046802 TaxID=3154919 RepID=UPI0033F177BB